MSSKRQKRYISSTYMFIPRKKRRIAVLDINGILTADIVGHIRLFCSRKSWKCLSLVNREFEESCLPFMYLRDQCFSVKPTLNRLNNDNRFIHVSGSYVSPCDEADLDDIEMSMIGNPASLSLNRWTKQSGDKLIACSSDTLSIYHRKSIQRELSLFRGPFLDLFRCGLGIIKDVSVDIHPMNKFLSVRKCELNQTWFDVVMQHEWKAVLIYGCTLEPTTQPGFPHSLEFVAIDCDSVQSIIKILRALSRDCPDLRMIVIHPTVDWHLVSTAGPLEFPRLMCLISFNTRTSALGRLRMPELKQLYVPFDDTDALEWTGWDHLEKNALLFGDDNCDAMVDDVTVTRVPGFHLGCQQYFGAPTGLEFMRCVYGALFEHSIISMYK